MSANCSESVSIYQIIGCYFQRLFSTIADSHVYCLVSWLCLSIMENVIINCSKILCIHFVEELSVDYSETVRNLDELVVIFYCSRRVWSLLGTLYVFISYLVLLVFRDMFLLLKSVEYSVTVWLIGRCPIRFFSIIETWVSIDRKLFVFVR